MGWLSSAAVKVTAGRPDVTPNTNGLPGIPLLRQIAGALLTVGLVAAVAGIAISAMVWAIGSHSGNPHLASRGKAGVVAAAAAGILIGGADAIVGFFSDAGSRI